MEFRLLGPVEVWCGGRQVPLGGAKPRALLTALLLGEGRVVTSERLVAVIWGEAPPPTARAVLQTYVASLRRSFKGAGMPDVIASHRVGYRTAIPAESLDSAVFAGLVDRARAESRDGCHREAYESFRTALALWRGPALGGIGDSFLRVEADRLDELRLTVTEERIAAELALGRAEELLGELRELVGRHPEHERLRRDLMLALYRCGRQSDSLTVFREGRALLVAGLGIEPGPELQQTHRAILAGDPALLVGVAPEPGIPQQLPSPPPDFTGRAKEISTLRAGLIGQPAMPIRVIFGAGGTGKSALATHVAQSVVEAFPDGQLYVELRGTTDYPATAEETLARLLRGLGQPAPLPSAVEERAGQYRSLLANRRVLVVFDDAATESQLRPLLPGGPHCAVMITSRRRLVGLAGAAVTELDVLSPQDALDLLVRVAGVERVNGRIAAAEQLASQCGFLPLAIRIAGARLAARPQLSIDALVSRLANEMHRLDELSAGDQEIRACIRLSYDLLAPIGRKALRRLGLLGLPSFPVWVAAAAIRISPVEAERVLEQLSDASLVDVDGVDEIGHVRYRLHDLIRLFARERAQEEESVPDRVETVTRVLGGWLWLIERIDASTPAGVITSRASYRHAVAVEPDLARAVVANPHGWFRAEEEALVVGVELASAMDLDEVAVELASALCRSVFVTDNLFEAWRRTHDAALAVARRTGNTHGEATLLAELGQLRCEQDRYAEAREFLSQALSMFRTAKDVRGEGTALAAIGGACREQGYLPEALHFLGRAEQLWAAIGDDAAMGHVLRLIGSVHLEMGVYAAAHDSLIEALSRYRAVGSRRGEALTLRTMSIYHRARDAADLAHDLGQQALSIFQELGDKLMVAYAMRTVAKAHFRLGRFTEAHPLLEDALIAVRALKDRWGEACTLRTLGELYLAEGRLYQAKDHLTSALDLWDALNVPTFRARTLRDLAAVWHALGEEHAAREIRAEAIEIFRRYGVREYTELSG